MRQSFWGWALLAVALAVPAFLFYRWREGMQGSQAAAISVIARDRLPAGGLFGKSPQQAKFQNPLDSSHAQGPASPAKAGAAEAPVSPPKAKPAAPTPVKGMPPAALAVSRSTDSAPASYAIHVARDPMLSPADFEKLRQMELEHEREEWLRLHPPKKKKRKIYRPPIESTVHLMGIIAVQGSVEAIVNNTPVGVGGRIGNIRILRINKDSVVFGYGDKTFVKSMGK